MYSISYNNYKIRWGLNKISTWTVLSIKIKQFYYIIEFFELIFKNYIYIDFYKIEKIIKRYYTFDNDENYIFDIDVERRIRRRGFKILAHKKKFNSLLNSKNYYSKHTLIKLTLLANEILRLDREIEIIRRIAKDKQKIKKK